jgi:FkbM family methyltransferase
MLDYMNFKLGPYDIIYPRSYSQFINEIFILDVYRASLLKKDDIVLDLGAATGDFCIVAARKVGPNGRVIAIEPNAENYKILLLNIKKNSCHNVTPLNLGVGNRSYQTNMIFWGERFRGRIETLENILDSLDMKHHLDFVKMDIEGVETEVTRKSIDLLKDCRVISLEFHDTKVEMDRLVLPHGFKFKPITMNYIYARLIRNLIFHPITLCKSIRSYLEDSRFQINKIFTGFDMTKPSLMTGTYFKE